MKLSFIKPLPELHQFIEKLWIFESSFGLPPTEGTIAAPNGCCKLTFVYGNSFVSTANGKSIDRPANRLNFVGSRDTAIALQSRPLKIGCIGIEFRPQGAFPLLGIPMDETFNFAGDADAVLGPWAKQVQEVLSDLESVDQRTSYIQGQLLALLRKNQSDRSERDCRHHDLVTHCVELLRSTGGRVPIEKLALETGYSRRYLNMLFKQHVGMAPKVLAQIFRFQLFHRNWALGQSFESLKNDAYEHYFDQSHFTREFKRMTLHSPREYCDRISNGFGRLVSVR